MTGGEVMYCWSIWLTIASTPGASCANSKLTGTAARGVPGARAAQRAEFSLTVHTLAALSSAIQPGPPLASACKQQYQLFLLSALHVIE